MGSGPVLCHFGTPGPFREGTRPSAFLRTRVRDLPSLFAITHPGCGMELAVIRGMGAKEQLQGSRGPLSSRAPAARPAEAGRRDTGPAASAAAAIELLSGLFDALPDAILVTDEEGRVLWVNGEFRDLVGLSPATLQGRRASVLAGPYEDDAEGRHVLALVRRGEGELELPAFKASGESFPCLVRVRTIDDLGGRPARLVSVTDQTGAQRLRAELVARAEAIRREKEILQATAACLGREGLVVADETERLVLVNAAARDLLGLREGELQGKPLAELPLPGNLRGAWLAFLAGPERAVSFTVRLPGPEGEKDLLIRLSRAWNSRGLPIASFLAARELESGEKSEHRRREFLARVGHELRTPLASIRGFVATLRAAPDLDGETREEFLEILDREAHRLERMVEALLEASRTGGDDGALSRQVLDLADLVRHAVALARERTPAAAIELDAGEGTFPCRVDPPRIERVILHLLENAAIHGGAGGSIEVHLARREGRARLAVRDHGPGVPPADLERIFDPLHRAAAPKRDAPVTGGLSLAVSRQVVSRHGGRLYAELPPGGGLAVILELPLEAHASPEEDGTAPGKDPRDPATGP